ncbi:MAG TPA: hypothetical protein VHX62_14405 [Solirubrobacteraceae bacterium]|jgi:hypothetical protein|nr:hypothetical protein [Solirubrobacteraceae bacterium]
MLALAKRQNGYVSRAQLLDLGATRGLIDGRVGSGFFVIVFPGVYAIAPGRDDALARASAVLLACGPSAVLSHGSAASLWGLRDRWERGPMHVTLATGDRRPRGIVTHRCRTLRRADTRRQRGIRATSPVRTCLDIAPRTPVRQLTRMINDGRRAGLIRLDALDDLLRRNPRHPGARHLWGFVAEERNPTRSALEDDFVEFVTKYGFAMPVINLRTAGHEADAVFERHRLIVELDGWDFHRDRDAFERDRERDANALADGWVTLRITQVRLHGAPEREAARLWKILEKRG